MQSLIELIDHWNKTALENEITQHQSVNIWDICDLQQAC